MGKGRRSIGAGDSRTESKKGSYFWVVKSGRIWIEYG